jgi:hypothetical protein
MSELLEEFKQSEPGYKAKEKFRSFLIEDYVRALYDGHPKEAISIILPLICEENSRLF